MATKTETAILEAVTAQQDVLKGLLDRMTAVEKGPPIVEVTSHDAAVATKKVTTLKTDDTELVALRGAITREGKAKLIDKCAAHSKDALQTLIFAGGRAAREFMADKRKAATAEEEYHLVNSANGRYAHAMLTRLEKGKGPTVVTSHSRTIADPSMNADMSDKELLKFRPKGASEKYAARHAWLKRTRVNLS
ncbi:hypothetical protein LCGC14_0734860 [marine sediment metagenome]|uniref:Uncharacterized protein n=1 Tax=marine sediment metagenome TaxID=412755 RepID=A0A0F9STJ3_9ZZZZ